MDMLVYFLPGILALGLITSYEDIRQGKIRNKWVISALAYSSLVNLGLIIYYTYNSGINLHYLSELGTNFIFAVLISFALWYMNIWMAGDSKLFIAYASLIPLSVYANGYSEWVPSLVLLVNVFMIGLFFMGIHILCNIGLKDGRDMIVSFSRNFFRMDNLFSSLVILFSVYWFMDLLLGIIGLHHYLLRMLLTVLIFSRFQTKLHSKSIYLIVATMVLRLVVDKTVYSFAFFREFLILVLVWKFIDSLLRESLLGFGKRLFCRDIDISDLVPGMLLCENIHEVEEDNLDSSAQGSDIAFFAGKCYYKEQRPGLEASGIIQEEAEGLTQAQVELVKGLGFRRIRIANTISFAPIMLIGTLLTLITGGNILILLRFLF